VVVVQKPMFVGPNATVLMKHKHICDTSKGRTHHGCYNIALQRLTSRPIHKMHGGVGGCESPEVI